jgi:hypothetical protein
MKVIVQAHGLWHVLNTGTTYVVDDRMAMVAILRVMPIDTTLDLLITAKSKHNITKIRPYRG